jgi:isopentenyl diphosphate isomerase/L-lactate dehydrogenase-like FMN-dependent dehydrogenase
MAARFAQIARASSTIRFRARRLVDVGKTDMSTTIFGKTWETPIFLCPVSGHRMYNPQGELATARAAKSKKHLQMLSTMTTTPVEDVNSARGEPVWFQLYTRPEWSQTRELVKRVEAAGCPALVFTVDLLGGRNTEMFNRVQQRNQQQCGACHKGIAADDLTNRPMVNALASSPGSQPEIGTPTWEYIKRLKDTTSMKIWSRASSRARTRSWRCSTAWMGVRLQSRRPRGQHDALHHRLRAGRRRRRQRPRPGVRGQRLPSRRRHLQSACARRDRGRRRPSVYLGPHGVWQEGVETVLDILRRELQLVCVSPAVASITRQSRETTSSRG